MKEDGFIVEPVRAALAVRVLLVEDSAPDAELLIDELSRDGLIFEWRLVDDEPAYRNALMEFRPDIVISDISMPNFCGYRALELLRERSTRIPFIFVSGTIDEDTAIEALRSGATDYVLKSNYGRFASGVRRALKEAEQGFSRDRTEEQLLRSQRYESLSLIAGGISHDLRNILQPLLFASSLITKPGADLPRVAKMVEDCSRRGLEMITSMLDFARAEDRPRERIQLVALFAAIDMLLIGSVPRNVVVDMERVADDISVNGNFTELQQCLLNLCLNALQAMPNGGCLQVRAENVTLDAAFFDPEELVMAGNYLTISVTDTGVGISPELQKSLFKPFFTTKSTGTGLGLLSCRRIVENHQGCLRIASVVGQGTTFSLYLRASTEVAGKS